MKNSTGTNVTGLTAPVKRNEGTVDQSLKADIIWLARKGFGQSGQPLQNRQNATFDGWQKTFERYNGERLKQSMVKPIALIMCSPLCQDR